LIEELKLELEKGNISVPFCELKFKKTAEEFDRLENRKNLTNARAVISKITKKRPEAEA
jgi:hypothetical protein